MKILVYGAGGVGGYFGARLAESGNKVSFIARGEHMRAIKESGLQLESINGDITVHPELVTSDIDEVETPDLILLGVKSWQLPEVASELKKNISKDTIVLPLQNGADNYEKLTEILPKENVLAGLCFIVSYIEKPGKIKHASFEPRIVFGEADNSQSERISMISNLFSEARIDFLNPENIQLEIWKKFLFICTISGIGGLTRVSIDKIRNSAYLFDLMKQTSAEIRSVANAKDIPLNNEHIEKAFQIIENQPEGTTASTQRDIMEGKPSEIENFNGYIVREGERLGIKTPVNKMIYECLKPMEEQARKTL
ncbi:2-dehydropantoate 2-reductase [uncultured Christiangramia sp.]|uniref:ketopantoate reductase family protein n=1 Tax=uncultured Christiangramia sp. TaxID=503836 RepID=UPI0025FBA03A|nr:2-dehydropantoate 2-reductase [uncultured Christiangramia sp.]|tara:strand:- start:3274 stop:4203 length:930 start_codon:yes stop_codon:yes gene_type:complete